MSYRPGPIERLANESLSAVNAVVLIGVAIAAARWLFAWKPEAGGVPAPEPEPPEDSFVYVPAPPDDTRVYVPERVFAPALQREWF